MLGDIEQIKTHYVHADCQKGESAISHQRLRACESMSSTECIYNILRAAKGQNDRAVF